MFPTNPDLADILGRTDLDFETFHFFDFLDPKFLDFQVPRSQNSQIPGFPGSHPALWIVGALSPTYQDKRICCLLVIFVISETWKHASALSRTNFELAQNVCKVIDFDLDVRLELI